MGISVFLDDYRTCPNDFVLMDNIDDCLTILKHYDVDKLSLDHDLVSKTRNGLMLVKKMVQLQLFAKHITIHSANSVGGKAMYDYFKEAQRNCLMPKTITVLLKPMPLY
ncbi:cyclic-phosphate processing receiver domain-containing protein [Bacillus testis]|uniref:cyclic-phosphate processing receiver domain-containing protein n=1 Tax=Bacillus testis TaxID=1622072 RepID=UPI00067EBA0E|nr:cyclic-phosphate processing receiver domain-containing protein [Bacillus testis]